MTLLKTPKTDVSVQATDFTLKNIDGNMVSLNDVSGKNGTIIMFISNHCPYVKAIIDRVVADCKVLQEEHGIGCVAIMPNDTEMYPDDSFENMKHFAENNGFTFPYIIDETQEVAKAYDAVCTPDIFGFNAEGQLQYRGRCDSAGPKPADDNTVRELRAAMMQIAQTGVGPDMQYPSMGCSIKWK